MSKLQRADRRRKPTTPEIRLNGKVFAPPADYDPAAFAKSLLAKRVRK